MVLESGPSSSALQGSIPSGGMQCAIAVRTEAGVAAFTFAAVNSR